MRVFSFLKNEYIWVILITVLVLIVSFFPTIHNLFITPSDKVYTMAYNYYPDYFQFVSWMRDGGNGDLALSSRFTPEVFPRKFGHTFFSIYGFVISIVSKNFFLGFVLGRIIFGFLRLLMIYFLISLLIKKKKERIVCFMAVIFLPSFYNVVNMNGFFEIRYFLPGITNFDVFRRLTFLPHHMMATILMILGLAAYSRGLKTNLYKYSLISAVLMFIASLVNPATILSMGVTLMSAGLILVMSLSKDAKRELIGHTAVSFLGIIAAIIYFKFYLFTVFPWDLFYKNDVTKMQWPFVDYLGALGWALPLGIIGIILARQYYKNILFVVVACWGLGSVLGVLISTHFSIISMFRLFQAQQAIPLGILSGIGIVEIFRRSSNRAVPYFFIIIIVLTSIPYYWVSFAEQMSEGRVDNFYLYVSKSTYGAYEFLDRQTPFESVVLAGYYSGQMLPAFSHNRVLVGHADGTYNYENKLDIMTRFYSNKYSRAELDRVVKENNISYFYFGPDTPRPENTSLSDYPSARLIYQNGDNYIYKATN